MKKFLATILAIVYLATSTGATLHMHYCMGKIYSVDLVKKDDCNKCGMKANKGCCRDEFKVLKVKDHKSVSGETNPNVLFAILNHNYNTAKPQFFTNPSLSSINNHSPPHSPGASLCVLNCVFRI